MALIYIPVCKYPDGEWIRETFLPESDFDHVLQDIWSGELEDLSYVYRLNTLDGSFEDATERFAENLGDMSLEKRERPYLWLRQWLTRMGIEFFDLDDDEARVSSVVQMRREHGTLNRAQQL